MKADQLRPLPASCDSVIPRVHPVRNQSEWYFDGDDDLAPGRWKVRAFGPANTYVCLRQSGGGPNEQNLEQFDIGYVLRQLRESYEAKRERGPVVRKRKK